MTGLTPPPTSRRRRDMRTDIAAEVAAERERVKTRGYDNDGQAVRWIMRVRDEADRGRANWMVTDAPHDGRLVRASLLTIAALAMNGIAAIDRQADQPRPTTPEGE